jgi:choline dehydrogenase
VIEACEQAGIPRNDDVNGAEQEGATYYQLTVKNGQRCSAAVAYLHPAMNRPNLQVETNALASRVIVRGQARGRRRVRPERRQAGGQGQGGGDPGRRGDQLAAVAAAVRRRVGRAAAPAWDRGHRRCPGVGENLQDHYVMASAIA